MPRNVSALEGEELKAQQTPVHLIYMGIAGAWGPIYANDSDVTLYMNTTTLDCSMSSASGHQAFPPMAELSIPVLELSDEHLLTEVTITASNVNQFWNGVINDNEFRDAPVTIWKGALRQAGASPDEVEFVGVVPVYTGRLDSLDATRTRVSLMVMPHSSPFTMLIPHEPYSPDKTSRFGGFEDIPPAGTKLRWGYSEREI